MAVSSVSFTKTPQAADDLFTTTQTGLTEDTLGLVSLNVMANDLGGAAKSLYSVDDGAGATDLLARDTARTEGASADRSANGATLWIGVDGRIGYDASTLSAAFKTQLQHLAAGQTLDDSFTYAIQLGNGTISTATVVVRIAGLNDGPVITSAPQAGAVQEDVQALATGQVTASDVDNGDHQHYALNGSGTGTYGSLSVDAATGAWTYAMDNASPLAQSLRGGESHIEWFTVRVTDDHGAFADQAVQVTVTGTNDHAYIGGPSSASLGEDDTAPASGTLLVTDVDAGEAHTVAASGTTALGSWSVDADGHWSYALNNAAAQHLAQNATAADSFTVSSLDGTATHVINITVNGLNDEAYIGGDDNGSLTEDSSSPATGTLVVTDVDDGEAHSAAASGTTALGSWSVDADGQWSYTVNNAAAQHLAQNATASDSFTVSSVDGTASQIVSITINGLNDAASISGNSSGSLNEDAVAAVTGTLAVADVDDGEAHTGANSGTTALGSWSVDADGQWSYTVNNGAVQHLAQNATASDSFTVSSVDGTASQIVSITINGLNDAASISGVSSGSLGEDAVAPVTGTLSVADVDDGQAHTTAASGTTAFGSWSVNTDGQWSYAVNNAAVQFLNDSQTQGDSFVVSSQDGTATRTVNITIVGATDNHPPVITSGGTGSEAENTATSNVVYQATATDVDGGPLGWSLGGADAARFNISSTGAVTFKTSPNFEAPTDAGGNNVYDITVTATDPLGASASRSVAISVSNVAEAPVVGNDFDFLQSGNDLQITLNGSTQTFTGFFGAGHSGTNTFALGDGQNATFTGNTFTFPAGSTFHGFALAGSYTVNQTLNGINGADIIASSNSGQTGDGGNGNDIVFGNGGNDTLTGGAGNDLILGGAGTDTLNGANSNDVLVGGAGADSLTGGSGDDRFVFLTAGDGVDTVTDFGTGSDSLDLRDVLSGYVAGTSAIGDFVKLTVAGGNTTVSVDANGSTAPNTFVDLAVLQGVVGLNLATMLADGSLIVS